MDDLLELEAGMQEDERMIRDSVARFVTKEVIPQMPEAFEKADFPESFIQKTAEMGLLGLTLPVAYGGSAASYVAYGLVCQELEKGDSGLRSFVSVQSSLCMYPIFKYGTEAQKKHYLPQMAKADLIGCFGLTESNAGSDPSGMHTYAKKMKGGYCLNGSKIWITNGNIADLAIIWAKTEDGIRGFLVEKGMKGFIQKKMTGKMSLRVSLTGELFFEDVFLPADHLLPGTTRG